MTFQDEVLIEKSCLSLVNQHTAHRTCWTAVLLPSCCWWDTQSASRPKKTGLDLPVQTVPGWVLWQMEGQMVVLSPHLILDTRRAAERWDSGLWTYCILYTSWWLYLIVVTVIFLLSFRDFQDWRREINIFSCDLNILSICSNQQCVHLANVSLAILECQGKPQISQFSVSMSHFHSRHQEVQRSEAGES